MNFDIFLFNFFYSFTHFFPFFNFLFIFFAEYFPWVLGTIAFVYILREKNKRKKIFDFFFIVTIIIFSRGLFTQLISYFFPRERPFETFHLTPLFQIDGNAFPSGHAAFFFALAFAMFYIRNKKWQWFFIGAIVISFARIICGVHWPSDILGGFVIAFLSFVLLRFSLTSKLLLDRQKVE